MTLPSWEKKQLVSVSHCEIVWCPINVFFLNSKINKNNNVLLTNQNLSSSWQTKEDTKMRRLRLYLSLTLPGDEETILVHPHLTVGLKDVRILQRGEKICFIKAGASLIIGFYLTWEDIKQATSLTHTQSLCNQTNRCSSNSFSMMYSTCLPKGTLAWAYTESMCKHIQYVHTHTHVACRGETPIAKANGKWEMWLPTVECKQCCALRDNPGCVAYVCVGFKCVNPAPMMLLYTHTLMVPSISSCATCSNPYLVQWRCRSRKSANISQLILPKHFSLNSVSC